MTLKEILLSSNIPSDLALDLIPEGDFDPNEPLDIQITVNGREIDAQKALTWWAEQAEERIGRALVTRLPTAIEEAEADVEHFARSVVETLASACAAVARKTPGCSEAAAEIWSLYGKYVPEYSD